MKTKKRKGRFIKGLSLAGILFSSCTEPLNKIQREDMVTGSEVIGEPYFAHKVISDENSFMQHATSIASEGNNLISVWYSGSTEGASDVKIMASRNFDDGWEEPWVIEDTINKTEGNPVVWFQGEKLWFLYSPGYAYGNIAFTNLRYKCSIDFGETFDEQKDLGSVCCNQFRNHPIQTSDGRIILPVYSHSFQYSFYYTSFDGGQSWKISEPYQGALQPAIVEIKDGKVLSLMRGSGGKILESISLDKTHYTKPSPTILDNPNSAIDILRLHSGNLILSYNPSQNHRYPLSVAISIDDGISWPYMRDITRGEVNSSYPSLAQTADGLVHLVYSVDKTSIHHAVFNEEFVFSDAPD